MNDSTTNDCLECGYDCDGKWRLCMKCDANKVGVTLMACESCGKLFDTKWGWPVCIQCHNTRIWGI